MPYQIKWKDGSVSDLSDSDFADLPKEMEADIGEITESKQSESKLPPLPEVPADTPSDISVVGFAHPTTLAKAQKYVESQEPGYVENALNYAMGESQEDPNALGQFVKGVNTGAEGMIQRPFESAAIVGSSLLPTTWPLMAQIGTAGVATGLGNLADQSMGNKPISTGEAVGSGIGAGLGTGLGYGLAKVAGAFARPIVDKLAKYREDIAVRAARIAKSEMDKLGRESDMELTRLLSRERGHSLGDPVTENEILGELYGATPEQSALAASNRETAEAMAQREHLDAIKKYMMENNPNRYSEFADVYAPTDKEALDFYLAAKEPIKIPPEIATPTLTAPKFVRDVASLPFSHMAAIRPLVGGKIDLTGTVGRNILEPTANFLVNPKLEYTSRMAMGLGLPYVTEPAGEIGNTLEKVYKFAKNPY